MEVGPHLIKKIKDLQFDLALQKYSVKVLKLMLRASWAALAVMGVNLFCHYPATFVGNICKC